MQLYRIIGLDVFRGIAIVLMVIYHFFFDLNHFGYISLTMDDSWYWRVFRYIIMVLFLFAVGISMFLTHGKQIIFRKVWQRFLQLAVIAFAISYVSWLQFPKTWIYFGMIHFIALSSLLGLLFLHKPKLTIIVALMILLGNITGLVHTKELFYLLQPILNLPYKTEDLVALFPWFGVVLVGIAFAKLGWHKLWFSQQMWHKPKQISNGLGFLGRHSLLIYIIHQPILFGVFMAISYI